MREAGLTEREVEILRALAEGLANGQIAKLLWLAEQTVKFHLTNIYRKLDVEQQDGGRSLGVPSRATRDRLAGTSAAASRRRRCEGCTSGPPTRRAGPLGRDASSRQRPGADRRRDDGDRSVRPVDRRKVLQCDEWNRAGGRRLARAGRGDPCARSGRLARGRLNREGVAGSPAWRSFAGYVCWTHYTQARADGAQVVWGLELAGIGCGLLALSGVRFLYRPFLNVASTKRLARSGPSLVWRRPAKDAEWSRTCQRRRRQGDPACRNLPGR